VILTPKNWSSFQHYKDRAPQWIKLHRALLDDFEFATLPVASRALAPLLWLLASEYEGGRIVASLDAIAFRMRVTRGDLGEALNPLIEAGFFSVSDDTEQAEAAEQSATLAQRIAKSNGFGTRHITDAVKREVWARDGGVCGACGCLDDIEYDHRVPVSKGGTADAGNIQLLCRPCNRKKRNKLAETAEQLDTDRLSSRSLEKDTNTREEVEKKFRAASPSNEDFENLRKVYPKRLGSYGWKAAERKFNALVKTGVDPQAIIAAAKRLCQTHKSKIGTEFIPMPASWLNSEDFTEIAAQSFVDEPAQLDWESVISVFQRTGHWSRYAGNDPSSPGCRAPPDILARYGISTGGTV
jgi:hypothetical protein